MGGGNYHGGLLGMLHWEPFQDKSRDNGRKEHIRVSFSLTEILFLNSGATCECTPSNEINLSSGQVMKSFVQP